MDIQRPATNKKRNRRIASIGIAALALVALTALAVNLANRPVGVDGDAIWTALVARGEFVHEVSASGKLIAPEIRAITNRSDGVVERIVVLPGTVVGPDDVLIELSSPQLQDDLVDARFELQAAEAEERSRLAQAEDRLLDMRAGAASAEAEYTTARLESDAKTALGDSQIFSAIEIEQARIRAEQLFERLQAEREKLERYPTTRAAEDAAAEAKLEQQRQKVMRLQQQADDLKVRARITGVVTEINVEAGERVSSGTAVARIVNPQLLIAQVGVSERDAGRVGIGQAVRLEVGRDIIEGRVTRIDPTVRDRLVTVDVELLGEQTSSVRPDVTVTARIVLDRVAEALLVDRPTNLRDEAETIDLFRITGGGDQAERVSVRVGRASARQIEILDGLEPGDEIILADMSDVSDQDVVRITGR